MKKLKETLQGIAFLFIGIPIMIMASIMDQRALKNEQDQRQKAENDHAGRRHSLAFPKGRKHHPEFFFEHAASAPLKASERIKIIAQKK